VNKCRFLIITAFFLSSCSTVSFQFDSRPIIINGVPFYAQEDYQCGPASIAGVLNYWGIPVKPEEIANEIYSSSARGSLNIDMLLYVNKKGLYSVQYSGSWKDVKENIERGNPLIVLVDYGFSLYQANHFMVVVGFSEEGVIVNSGSKEHDFIEKEKFLKIWRKTKYWSLLIERR